MLNDKHGPRHKTTQCFRTVPRKHVDHVNFHFDGEEHVSANAYNPKFTQVQIEINRSIIFSQN